MAGFLGTSGISTELPDDPVAKRNIISFSKIFIKLIDVGVLKKKNRIVNNISFVKPKKKKKKLKMKMKMKNNENEKKK